MEKHLQQSLHRLKKQDRHLENRLKILTKAAMEPAPLSRQFSELQNQFNGFITQFRNDSPNSQKTQDNEPIQPEKPLKGLGGGFTEEEAIHLTQLEQKGLIFIGRLQDETKSPMIPVGVLTSNLYPDRPSLKIKTTVSNILKKLIHLGLVNRERRGNYWYIGLSAKGYNVIKKLLQQNPLKNLIELYEEK